MNVPATQYRTLEQQPSEAEARFTYASGSRPLDGFTLKRGIGQGGFGEVYYATSDAGKEVALKLVRRNLDVELRGVTQCLNLKHPNLLALYDIRQDSHGDSWVVMEYVAGESLESVIERHPVGMPLADALRWMQGIAAAVGYLHDHGIVHRDLKPGNIFIDEGVVKVGDYGLSKFMSCSRRSGQTGSVGTVHYMAPEVANGRYGKEIDLYALGIMLYEMLTGHVPFEGESIGEVLMKHLTAMPDLSRLEEPFRSVVAKALAKDPRARLNSAEEMASLLAKSSGGAQSRPAQPATPPVAQRTPAWQTVVPLEVLPAGNTSRAGAQDEEPILRAFKNTWNDLRTWWDRKPLSAPGRVALLVVTLFILVNTAGAWLPTLLAGLVLYGGYRVVRAIVLSFGGEPAAQSPVAQRGFSGQPPPRQPAASPASSATLNRWRQEQKVPPKSNREKTTELITSLLVSAGVAAITSLVGLILRGQPFELNQLAFVSLVGTVGAWCVLVPAKFWEGKPGEVALRRFVMMVFGLVLGGASATAMTSLLVHLSYDPNLTGPLPRYELPTGFYAPDGSPQVLSFLAYFGFLFLIPKWWRQADPWRPTRLSLWSTAVCVFWSAALNVFWPFPQPWGMMLAATISVAVQLASPWSAGDKHRPRQAYS